MDMDFMYFQDDANTVKIENISPEEIVATEEIVTSEELEQGKVNEIVQNNENSPKLFQNSAEVYIDFCEDDLIGNTPENNKHSGRIDEENCRTSIEDTGENGISRNSRNRRTKASTSNSHSKESSRKNEEDKTTYTNTTLTSSPYGTRKSARKVLKKQDYYYDDDDVPKIKTKRQEGKNMDKLIKMINETCSQLETIGKDVLVLIADIKGPRILGSKAGVEFANETKIITSEFQHFCDERRSKKNKTLSSGGQKFTQSPKTTLDKDSPQKQEASRKGIKRQLNSPEEVDKASKFNKVIKVKLKGMNSNESETIGNITISVDKAVAGKDIAIESVTMGEKDDSPELDAADFTVENRLEVSDENEEHSAIGDDEDDYTNDASAYQDSKNETEDSDKGKQSEFSVMKKEYIADTLDHIKQAKELLNKWAEMDFGVPRRVTTIRNFGYEDHETKLVTNGPETFPCDRCGFVFLLDEHLKTHQTDMMNCDRRDLKIPFHSPDDYRFDNLALHYAEQSNKHDIFLMKDLLKDQISPPFKCFICKKLHQTLVQLKRHLLSHSNTNAYNCPICGKQMKLFESFNKHVLKHFTTAYGCENCYRFFSSKDELDSHAQKCAHSRVKIPMDNTGQSQKLSCETCGYLASDVTALVIHQTHHSKASVVQCPLCEQKLAVGSLKRHMVVAHQESTPVMCETCGKRFKDKLSLRRHARLHNDEIFSCPVCGKKFADKEYLARHMGTHSSEKKFICDHCGAGYNKKLYFDNHLRKHTGETPYSCTVQGCDKKFRCIPNLRQHIRSHNLVGEFVCDFCGKQFKQRGQLSRHRKSHTVEFGWACVYCPEKFKSCWKYKQHLVIKHPEKKDEIERTTNIRLHKCHICGKLYHDTEDLQRHVNAHNGIKPFKCSYCNKGFVDRSNLKAHEHIHKGTVKFKCRICYKSFLQENNLLKHMKSNHPEMYAQEGNSMSTTEIDNAEMLPKVEGKMPDVLQRLIASRNDKADGQSNEIVIDCLDTYQLQILETQETILS